MSAAVNYWTVFRENLEKFISPAEARKFAEETCQQLKLDSRQPMAEDAMNKLADFLIAKGTPYSFVGRMLRISWINDSMKRKK